MNILHIDSSITGQGSTTRRLSRAVVADLLKAHPRARVVRRDLEADPIPHLDGASLATVRTIEAPAPQGEAARTAALLQELQAADVLVIGAPMYNFGMPSQLKAWFDRVLIAGKTFAYTAEGPKGLLSGKRAVVVSARGGVYAPGTAFAAADFQEPHLRALLGFIGIGDVSFVRAEGLALGDEQREAAIAAALAAGAEAAGRAMSLAA